MLGELQLATLTAEWLLEDYLVGGTFQPIGDVGVFLNDRTRAYVQVSGAAVRPLAPDRQVAGPAGVTIQVARSKILAVSLVKGEEAAEVRRLAASRAATFYVGPYAIRGQVHVNADARDEDLLDDARDFYPVSDAQVFPLRPLANVPSGRVPLLFINRLHLPLYQAN